MKNIYTSIDIGSNSIKIVVCELYKNKLNLLAATNVKTKSVKHGIVVDMDLARIELREAVKKIEEMLGVTISQVLCSLPSNNTNFNLVHGTIKINGTYLDENTYNSDIEGSDIKALLQRASYTVKSEMDEMLTLIPIDFKIDNKVVVKTPLGMPASKLDVRAIHVSVPRKTLIDTVNLVESIGLIVKDISISGIGDMYAFKNKEIDERIGAIINIGSDTTVVSLYNKGVIVKNSVINIGSKNVDNDLSYIYKINNDVAINIKEKFAYANKRHAKASEVYEVANNQKETIKINQLEATEIISARLGEILKIARREISKLTNREVDYILITGGISNMTNFSLLATEILGSKAVVGNMKLIGVRNNAFSTSVGNIVYYISKLKLLGIRDTMIDDSDVNALTSINSDLATTNSETMLSKVFGYFFNE